MECKKYVDDLSAYIDGELSSSESHQLTLHLLSCSKCAEEYTSLLKMQNLINNEVKEEIPDESKIWREVESHARKMSFSQATVEEAVERNAFKLGYYFDRMKEFWKSLPLGIRKFSYAVALAAIIFAFLSLTDSALNVQIAGMNFNLSFGNAQVVSTSGSGLTSEREETLMLVDRLIAASEERQMRQMVSLLSVGGIVGRGSFDNVGRWSMERLYPAELVGHFEQDEHTVYLQKRQEEKEGIEAEISDEK